MHFNQIFGFLNFIRQNKMFYFFPQLDLVQIVIKRLLFDISAKLLNFVQRILILKNFIMRFAIALRHQIVFNHHMEISILHYPFIFNFLLSKNAPVLASFLIFVKLEILNLVVDGFIVVFSNVAVDVESKFFQA